MNDKLIEVIEELVASIPYEGIGAVYNDGSLTYMSQGGMTWNEFEGITKRIASIDLSASYWRESFEIWELDVNDYDETSDEYKELKNELYESIDGLIWMSLDNATEVY